VAAEAERHLTTSGTGHVEVQPDIAILSVGATTRAPQASEALEAANAVVRRLFERARALGVAERDLATTGLRVSPVYGDRRRTEELPQPVAFQAENQVEITIRELDKAGEVIDAMSEAGANTIGGLRFTVADPQPHEDEARRLAVQDARRRAELYAAAAGVALGPVLTIEENGVASIRPTLRAAAMEARTPVAPGETTIAAGVTITFALGE
jgi:uncharacterized protein YggE